MEWYLLGEYSLSSFLPDPEKGDQRTSGLPPITLRETGIPLDWMEPVETALKSIAREELAGQIRIYCQKKIIDEEMKGGWGYFVIKKPKDASSQDGLESQDVIDFYIYEEGQ